MKYFIINPRNNSIFIGLSPVMLSTLLLAFSIQFILVDDELYFNALIEQMTVEQISELVDKSHHWEWLGYVILLTFSLTKFTLTACCLGLGYYLITSHWLFKPFFKAAIQAEFVLLIPGLIKLIWFLFIQTDYTLNDLQLFYPLSLLNLFEPGTVEPYLLYPLQVLNLFEVAYWFVLAYGVAQVMNASLERGFGLVMASYGLGLVLWVVFVMFLTVSLS